MLQPFKFQHMYIAHCPGAIERHDFQMRLNSICNRHRLLAGCHHASCIMHQGHLSRSRCACEPGISPFCICTQLVINSNYSGRQNQRSLEETPIPSSTRSHDRCQMLARLLFCSGPQAKLDGTSWKNLSHPRISQKLVNSGGRWQTSIPSLGRTRKR